MSLVYKVGDLIKAAQDGDVNIIAHGCNCLCNMGSGIAPQIAKAFPTAHTADQATVKGDRSKLGKFSFGTEPSGLTVFNLYSQFDYYGRSQGRRDLSYDALVDSLTAMTKHIVDHFNLEDVHVGLPQIGAGLAKGDWQIIERVIERTLVKAGISTVIYVLPPKGVHF